MDLGAKQAVGVIGFGVLVSGIVSTYMHEASNPCVAQIVAGAAMMLIAPKLDQIEELEIGPDHIKATVDQSEDDIGKGNVVEADKAVKAAEAMLGGAGTLRAEVKPSTEGGC